MTIEKNNKSVSESCAGDLQHQITSLIGQQSADGHTQSLTPQDVSRILHTPFAEVEKCMKEIGA